MLSVEIQVTCHTPKAKPSPFRLHITLAASRDQTSYNVEIGTLPNHSPPPRPFLQHSTTMARPCFAVFTQILQMYASQEILLGSAEPSATGEAADAAAAAPKKRTPAQLLLEEILNMDADKWDGVLAGLSAVGRGMTGGVTKDGLLGAIQVGGGFVSRVVGLRRREGCVCSSPCMP